MVCLDVLINITNICHIYNLKKPGKQYIVQASHQFATRVRRPFVCSDAANIHDLLQESKVQHKEIVKYIINRAMAER